jgi:putative oxidoreductase
MIEMHESFAVFIARVFLGMLFFFQGYDKVFKVGINGVIKTVEYPYKQTGLPRFLLVAGAYITSYLELICGALLILGLFKYPALYLLGFDLLIASAGLGMLNHLWDTKHALPRIILLLLLLFLPSDWDTFSLDYLLG